MVSRIREFNDKNRALYVFISIIILIVVLLITSVTNKNKTVVKNNTTCNINISNTKNISYNVKIKKDGVVILYTVKRYNNKFHIEKTENGHVNYYYMYFNNLYISDDDINYVLYNNDISEGIDIKLLLLDYISDITSYTINMESVNNCYLSSDKTINACVIDNNTMTIEVNDLFITYELNNIGEVNDFNVNTINE